MTPRYTIVGAGPVGTLLALLLAQRGAAVRLLERRGDPRLEGAGYGRSINLALAARGIGALERAALMPRVAPHTVMMRGRMLHDERGHTTFMRYGQDDSEVLYAIGRDRLNRILIEAAAANPAIELHFRQRCIDVDPGSHSLLLRDEDSGALRTEPFAALLGADGAGSAVRTSLVRQGLSQSLESALEHDYQEYLIAPTTDGYAFEGHALHIWPRGGYMLIALPNTDLSFTATLFLPRRGQVSFEALQATGAVHELFTRQFGDAALGIRDLDAQYRSHPQSHLGTLHCDRWHCADDVLLVGDAAHAIVPFHGQGLNCGFEDCVLLDELLAHPGGHATAFAQFERQRRPNTDAIAAMALDNYLEMRDTVRSRDFARRKRLAIELEHRYPQRFIPRYSMVMFHPEIPYAEAQRRGARQEQVLDVLLAKGNAADDAAVRRLLDEAHL